MTEEVCHFKVHVNPFDPELADDHERNFAAIEPISKASFTELSSDDEEWEEEEDDDDDDDYFDDEDDKFDEEYDEDEEEDEEED